MRCYKRKPGYPVADCPAVWQRYRKAQRFSLTLVVLWPVIVALNLVFLAILPLLVWHRAVAAPVFFSVLGFSGSVLVLVGKTALSLRCPNCGYRFFAWGPWGLLHSRYTRKCRNCGLYKWTCNNPA